VAGALVHVEHGAELPRRGRRRAFAVTGSGGSFQLSDLAPIQYNVTATVRGLVPAGARRFLKPGPNEIELRVAPGGVRVSGRVLDEKRVPVARALVFLRESWLEPAPRTLTDTEGRFEIHAEPDRRYELGVEADGFLTQSGEAFVLRKEGQQPPKKEGPHTFVLQRAAYQDCESQGRCNRTSHGGHLPKWNSSVNQRESECRLGPSAGNSRYRGDGTGWNMGGARPGGIV
jgi:hypothetical protein